MAGDDTGLTIKEYLVRIDGKVDRIEEKLDTKADITVVSSLEGRIRQLEVVGSVHAQAALNEVATLKASHKAELDQLWANINWLKKKVWIVAGASGAVATLWSVIHTGIVHLG